MNAFVFITVISLMTSVVISLVGFECLLLSAFLSGCEQIVQAFFKNASLDRFGTAMDDCSVTHLWSFAVAVFSVGGMIGSLCVGILVNRFGR